MVWLLSGRPRSGVRRGHETGRPHPFRGRAVSGR